MKKLFILTILTALSLTSCLKNDNDVFDQSASERIEAAVDEAHKVLQNAPNGWRMEIYPNPDRIYGGYTIFVKFDAQEVTAMGEIFGSSVTDTSYYSVSAESGPMLSFDTYNDVVHFFSDAAYGASSGIGEKQFGLHGDSDFIVLSADPSAVVLKGRKTGNRAFLYPVESGTDWADEVDAYVDIAERIESLTFNRCTVNGSEADLYFPGAVNNFTQRAFSIVEPSGKEVDVYYVNTKTGIKFYEPVEIGGKTIDHMEFVDDWYLTTEDGSLQVLSPEPIRSDMTFAVDFSDITYSSVKCLFLPSNNEEYYYMGVYDKSVVDTYTDRALLRALLTNINSTKPATAALAANGYQGGIAGTVSGLQPETGYVAVLFGISLARDGGSVVSTTNLYRFEFTTAEMPPLDPAYEQWLGTWEVTSTTSTKGNKLTYDVTIDMLVPNESVTMTGLSMTTYRLSVSPTAVYNPEDGTITVTASNKTMVTENSTYELYYYGYYFNASGGNTRMGGTYTGLVGSHTGDGTAEIECGWVTSSSVGRVQLGGLEIFGVRKSDGGTVSFVPADGYTSGDYGGGPYHMKKIATRSEQAQTRGGQELYNYFKPQAGRVPELLDVEEFELPNFFSDFAVPAE